MPKKREQHRHDDGTFKNIPPGGMREPSGGTGGRITGRQVRPPKTNIGNKPLKQPSLDQDAGGGYNTDDTSIQD